MEQRYIARGEEESMDLYDFLAQQGFKTPPFHKRKTARWGSGIVANGIYDEAGQDLATLSTEDSGTLGHEPVHTITIYQERKGSDRLVRVLNEFTKLRAQFLQLVPQPA